MTGSAAGGGPGTAGSAGGEGGPGASGPAEAGGGKSGGMSTGAKVLFACLGLTVLGIVALAAVVLVGGFALKRGAESVMATVEEQQQAGEILRRLEEEHPFQPPDDGVVGEERAARVLAVTDDAWEEIRPLAEDLSELREAASLNRGGLGRLRDMASGARAMGGFARSRVELAEALDAHDTSLGEYLWAGIQLDRAADAVEGERPTESVPAANLELARRHAGELPRLNSTDEEGPGVVLAVAVLWGMTDLSTWEAMGLDTLTAPGQLSPR